MRTSGLGHWGKIEHNSVEAYLCLHLNVFAFNYNCLMVRLTTPCVIEGIGKSSNDKG